jgi:hypothetical protein
VLCCGVLQVGVLLPLVRLLMVGDSQTQRAAALLVGQFAAPPLEPGALTVGLGERHNGCGRDHLGGNSKMADTSHVTVAACSTTGKSWCPPTVVGQRVVPIITLVGLASSWVYPF